MRVALVLFCLASTASVASANCLGTAAIPARETEKFKNDPAAYVSGMSEPTIRETVYQMAASDVGTLSAITSLIKSQPTGAQIAISNGLGLAAQSCAQPNPDEARAIQVSAADFPANLRVAFDEGAKQRSVGLAGAAAGSPGSAGGQVSPFGSLSRINSGDSSPNRYSSVNGPTTVSGVSISGSSTQTTTTTRVINSVQTNTVFVPVRVSP